MAVQQRKKTRSRRGMRRSHHSLTIPNISIDSSSGEFHLRHHLTRKGFYRGKEVVKNEKQKRSILHVDPSTGKKK